MSESTLVKHTAWWKSYWEQYNESSNHIRPNTTHHTAGSWNGSDDFALCLDALCISPSTGSSVCLEFLKIVKTNFKVGKINAHYTSIGITWKWRCGWLHGLVSSCTRTRKGKHIVPCTWQWSAVKEAQTVQLTDNLSKKQVSTNTTYYNSSIQSRARPCSQLWLARFGSDVPVWKKIKSGSKTEDGSGTP